MGLFKHVSLNHNETVTSHPTPQYKALFLPHPRIWGFWVDSVKSLPSINRFGGNPSSSQSDFGGLISHTNAAGGPVHWQFLPLTFSKPPNFLCSGLQRSRDKSTLFGDVFGAKFSSLKKTKHAFHVLRSFLHCGQRGSGGIVFAPKCSLRFVIGAIFATYDATWNAFGT